MTRCPRCKGLILEQEAGVTCEACHTLQHEECWEKNRGCNTAGCPRAPERGGTGEAYQAQWENQVKQCPYCKDSIPMNSLVCPSCKTAFGTVHVQTTEDVRRELLQRALVQRRSAGSGPVFIFILSLIGILAPAVLLFGGVWFWFNRESVKTASPAHHLIACVGLCLSAFYLFLMLAGPLFYGR